MAVEEGGLDIGLMNESVEYDCESKENSLRSWFGDCCKGLFVVDSFFLLEIFCIKSVFVSDDFTLRPILPFKNISGGD